MNTYTIRIDKRGRDVLLNALKLVKNSAEEPISSGNFDDEDLRYHEELLQLHRGILYVRPDPIVEDEEPVVGPEAGINQSSGESTELDNQPE